MKRYKVIDNSSCGTHQVLTVVRTCCGISSQREVFRAAPIIPVGTIINVYEMYLKDIGMKTELAQSYKVDGKYYMDLFYAPINQSGIVKYCNSFCFLDGLRFNWDIARILRQRNISPSCNKYTNLRLFLSEMPPKTL